jgi:hypothetical protein
MPVALGQEVAGMVTVIAGSEIDRLPKVRA